MDRLYCCTFALGGNCEHSHKENSYIKCLTCFSFFKKSFAFPENINEEVYSNNKDEVATMTAEFPNLSYAVSHYDSHHLRDNVQFYAT